MNRIRLTETENWKFNIEKAELLSAIDKLTGSKAWQNSKRKDKVNLYIGYLTNSGFYIRENPNIGRLTPISGTINHTRFTGKLQGSSKGTEVEVKGSREDIKVIAPIIGPIIIGLILILNLTGYPLYQLAVGAITVTIELLIIRGVNSEVRDGMAKLKKKLSEIEMAHHNNC